MTFKLAEVVASQSVLDKLSEMGVELEGKSKPVEHREDDAWKFIGEEIGKAIERGES